MNTDLYETFLKHLFDHKESKGDWFWDDEYDIDISKDDRVTIQLLTFMFENYEDDVDSYSDWQIGKGLNYIFGECFTYAYTIRDGNAPAQSKVDAILGLKNIYKNCFNKRCEPILGHLATEESNPLNWTCYMFWDVAPFGTYPENKNLRDKLQTAIFEVLEYALQLDNITCIESALHGLGHFVFRYPEAESIIKRFILRTKNLDPRLLEYALQAQTGQIL